MNILFHQLTDYNTCIWEKYDTFNRSHQITFILEINGDIHIDVLYEQKITQIEEILLHFYIRKLAK